MQVMTNMSWPEDPYGTGQLWRKEPHLLAGFAVCWTDGAASRMPLAYAVVYLKLHRTQTADLTSGISFGFRSASTTARGQSGELVRLLDLDIMRARRLAKVVGGLGLQRDLSVLGGLAGGDFGRGIRGLRHGDAGSPSMARVVDLAGEHDVLAAEFAGRLECGQHALPDVEGVLATERLCACATERALVYAIAAGRELGRFIWNAPLDVGAAMTANAWDCFGSLELSRPRAAAGGAA